MSAADIKTVLVVEDSDDIRTTLRHFLQMKGYAVAEAVNGQEAVDFVDRRCPDLILMDLNMPVMDGLAATERIRQCREICKRVPIIAATAFDTYGMKEAALAAGCTDYILKPIEFEKLDEMIRLILVI